MTTFPTIVVGTYEEFLLGYKLQYENENNVRCKFHQSFATHSHQASVRCIATHNNLMASSGADEYINIYDMVAMQVSTVINYHDSTVTCLEFTPDGSHLVTANQNGDIVIFRCKDWALVKLWKKSHNNANGVSSVNVHPSGSLLLTAGADNVIRFWNLVKGRQAYATNFSKKCTVGNSLNFGMWSKNGKFYAISFGNTLEIYKTETAALAYEITSNSKITSSAFIKKNLICFAKEDGFLEIHSIHEKKLLQKKQAHKSRVKSLSSFSIEICKNNKNLIKNYIVSVDSKGGIKIWYLKKKHQSYSLLLRGEVDCDCRITCLTMVFPEKIKQELGNASEPISSNDIIQVFSTKEGNDEKDIVIDDKKTDQIEKEKKNKFQKIKRKLSENENSIKHQNGKRLKNEFYKNKKNQISKLTKEKVQLKKNKKSADLKIFKKGFKSSSKTFKQFKKL